MLLFCEVRLTTWTEQVAPSENRAKICTSVQRPSSNRQTRSHTKCPTSRCTRLLHVSFIHGLLLNTWVCWNKTLIRSIVFISNLEPVAQVFTFSCVLISLNFPQFIYSTFFEISRTKLLVCRKHKVGYFKIKHREEIMKRKARFGFLGEYHDSLLLKAS